MSNQRATEQTEHSTPPQTRGSGAMIPCRWNVYFVTALALAACVEARPPSAHDVVPDASAVADILEVVIPVDILELRFEITPEVSPIGLEDDECTGHYDCLPGWYTCEDGEMIAAFYGPIPCWVNLTCEEAGNSWPCLSGVCGPHELCTDDIDHLESLVPDDAEWRTGTLELTSSSDAPSGHWSCFNSVCTWHIVDGEGSVLKFRLPGLSNWVSESVTGTTHLVSVSIPGSGVKDLSLEGSPVEIAHATFVWAPLEEFTIDNNGSWPRMGYSGALTIDSSEGVRTVIVWLREASYTTPVKVAIHSMNIAGDCQPPKPFLLGDTCVECLSTADCGDEDLACTPENHRCEPADGACGYCEEPYPACAYINGVWSCVQCKYDEDCPEGKECEPDLYFCNGGGETFCEGCITDDDCQSLWGDFQLECDVATGCCQDVTGLCDGVEAFCPYGECKGLWSDFLGCGVWPTSENEACENIDPGLGLCTCSAPVDLEDPSSCPPPDFCAGGACPPEAVCFDASVVELMFGASAPFDDGVCLPLDWMVSYL